MTIEKSLVANRIICSSKINPLYESGVVSKVLKARYYPKDSIFKCKVPDNASWIWKGLMGARNLVEKGVRRRIGNGKSTQIWEDSWIPDNQQGKVTSCKPQGCIIQKVEDLINQGRWNRQLIFRYFSSKEAERILSIPISLAEREDSNFWIYGSDGNYSVNSAYRLLLQERKDYRKADKEDASTSWSKQCQRNWGHLWKVKIFWHYQLDNLPLTGPSKVIQCADYVERRVRQLNMHCLTAIMSNKCGGLPQSNAKE